MKWQGDTLILGELPVGKVWSNGVRPKGSPDEWLAVINLPPASRLRAASRTEAQEVLMRAVLMWLDKAGLLEKD